jgi:hypothetical protein
VLIWTRVFDIVAEAHREQCSRSDANKEKQLAWQVVLRSRDHEDIAAVTDIRAEMT